MNDLGIEHKKNERPIFGKTNPIRASPRRLDGPLISIYTQVATNVIRAIMSPLDRLTPLTPEKNRKDQPPA